MRALFIRQTFNGNRFKNFLRALSLLATLAASLAMAQQGTPSTANPDARQQPNSGASKWGPTRNPTTSTGPHASTAATTRAQHSVQQQPGSTPGIAAKQAAHPSAHSAGTASSAGESAASSPSEAPVLATRATSHSSGNSRGSKSKTHATALNSGLRNRDTLRGSAGIHPRAKLGVHKTKKRVTW